MAWRKLSPGAFIPLGPSWKWVGGPLLYYRTRAARWRFRVRFVSGGRGLGDGPRRFHPGIFLERDVPQGSASALEVRLVWNPTRKEAPCPTRT